MKAKVLVLAIAVAVMSSCTYRVCPTYAKKDVKPTTEQKAEKL